MPNTSKKSGMGDTSLIRLYEERKLRDIYVMCQVTLALLALAPSHSKWTRASITHIAQAKTGASSKVSGSLSLFLHPHLLLTQLPNLHLNLLLRLLQRTQPRMHASILLYQRVVRSLCKVHFLQ